MYETYDGATVSIIDARGDECVSEEHRPGLLVPTGPITGQRASAPVQRDSRPQ